MSSEEKHNLKSFLMWLQAGATALTILAILGVTTWVRGEFEDIHYAAKQTPILERRINKTDSTVKELYVFVGDSIVNRLALFVKRKNYVAKSVE